MEAVEGKLMRTLEGGAGEELGGSPRQGGGAEIALAQVGTQWEHLGPTYKSTGCRVRSLEQKLTFYHHCAGLTTFES